jgi:nicotinamidase-related amidase
MALTTLDTNTALIVIDLQKGLLSYPAVQPLGDIAVKAALLADAFRRHGLPVVLVNVGAGAPGRTERPPSVNKLPEGWTDLLPELGRQPQDLLLTKRTWGAFASTELAARLKERGITQVVIAGFSTSIGVESTARQAFESGFNVTLAIDAMTDTNADAHANSIERIFPRLGETGRVDEIVALLESSRA